MIRIRFLQNTVLFVNRSVKSASHGGVVNKQRQWHVMSGDIHAVESVNSLNENQYQIVLPNSETINGIDKGIIEVMRDVPQTKSKPGCGGCGH